MKKYKSKTSGVNKTRLKKRAKLEEKIFIGVLISAVIYYLFFESISFGEDYRYQLYVFWLPVVLGFFLAIKYSYVAEYWSSLLEDIKKEKHFLPKIIYPIFLFVMTFMYSVMMFWMPSNMIWDVINKMEASNNKIEVFQCTVQKFDGGKRESIDFYFNKSWGSIPVHYETVKPYLDKNPKNYKIKIKVKKGIWNYYVLEDFDIL